MRAAYASAIDPDNPLAALTVGEIEPPETPADWVTVDVRASSLNHHDLWSLRGVGLPADRLPMVLGCDAAGWTRTATRSSCTRSSAPLEPQRGQPRPTSPTRPWIRAGPCCPRSIRGR